MIRNKQKMHLFRATNPLESVAVYLFRCLSRTGHSFLLVIAAGFTKLTQVFPLRHTTALEVAMAFSSHLVFECGAPKEVLTDSRPQFASMLYQNTFRVLGVVKMFAPAYHQQRNDHVESFNQPLADMLHC